MLKTLRRALLSLALTLLAAAIIHLSSRAETPTRHGGWRELDPSELD